MKILPFKTLLLFLVTLLVFACKKEASTPSQPPEPTPEEKDSIVTTPEESFLISFEEKESYTSADMKLVAQLSGYPEYVDQIKYGATEYYITYTTQLNGEDVTASGMLYLPDTTTASSALISVQHGTMFEKKTAPSVNPEFPLSILFSGLGYVTLEPDYIGYGASVDYFHPYYDKESSAQAVIDGIRAAYEYLDAQNLTYSDKLFLTGYSEGGYVTLATQQKIEQEYSDRFNLTAVAPGAGGYDLTQIVEDITEEEYYSYPAYLAFIITSYHITYNWSTPYSNYFKAPYASKFPEIIDGFTSGNAINQELTTELPQLLDSTFYSNLENSEIEIQFEKALKKNSIINWKPQTPLKNF